MHQSLVTTIPSPGRMADSEYYIAIEMCCAFTLALPPQWGGGMPGICVKWGGGGGGGG